MKFSLAALALSWSGTLLPVAQAAYDIGFKEDNDLTTFVTRPEIRAPLFQVNTSQPDRVTPGYWFIAPYANLVQDSFPRSYYQPCQTGPAIYDNNGDLVWTGACLLKNRNVCDFKLVEFGDTSLLSGIVLPLKDEQKGFGAVLNASFSATDSFTGPKLLDHFNMHEFTLTNDGKSAISIISRPEHIEFDEEFDYDEETGWILNMGFREADMETGETIFEWWAYPEVRPQESKVEIDDSLDGPYPTSWNLFHFNSVDKNADGDYMISSRYTDTIFKVSGKTGKLEWRLEGSGKTSDFALNFNFSRQHDARWIEYDEKREVISFLDNGADSNSQSANASAVYIVELDKRTSPWSAKVLQRWERPDHSLSRLRGNAQVLSNGNLFTCWSDNSYLTEHSADGELLMSASFRSKRFVTYRGYKFNFTGTPRDPPVLKAVVSGVTPDRSTTAMYVSWNGATEVDSWSFYGVTDGDRDDVWLGVTPRTGFETSFYADGYTSFVYAEAIAADGTVLGRTTPFAVDPLKHWNYSSAAPLSHSLDRVAVPMETQQSLDWQNHATDNSTSLKAAGCSIYSGGCEPTIAQKPLRLFAAVEKEL